MKAKILLVEDDKLMRVTLEDSFLGAGYYVFPVDTGGDAIDALKENTFDLVVTDVRLPDIDGFKVIEEASKSGNCQTIMMTGYGTIKDAVEAMRLGAFDYVTKPFALDEFLLIVGRALEVKLLREENTRLKKDIGKRFSAPNIVGESNAMKMVLSLVERVSRSDSNVLIMGESGTGKELIATMIHYQSSRKNMPLIKVNCAALPDGLIESELFGHEKGAFTGAVRKKPGRFEMADRGTIFLDEIGDLPAATQAKILRVIQERTFERVGGTETLGVDTRIIAATNKDLEEEVKKGVFRQDLYYRLNVIPITLPPLRQRREDIPGLLDFFLKKCKGNLAYDVQFSSDAVDALMSYSFPGNVRELQNVIERCLTLSVSGLITRDDLPPFLLAKTGEGPPASLTGVASEAEKEHIIKILKITKGNKTKTAEILGISRKTLWDKINTYGIER
jgi:two-component system response regulator AtoC